MWHKWCVYFVVLESVGWRGFGPLSGTEVMPCRASGYTADYPKLWWAFITPKLQVFNRKPPTAMVSKYQGLPAPTIIFLILQPSLLPSLVQPLSGYERTLFHACVVSQSQTIGWNSWLHNGYKCCLVCNLFFCPNNIQLGWMLQWRTSSSTVVVVDLPGFYSDEV